MSKLESKEDVQSLGLIYKAYSMPDLHRERHQRLSSRKMGKDTRTRFSKMPPWEAYFSKKLIINTNTSAIYKVVQYSPLASLAAIRSWSCCHTEGRELLLEALKN